MIDFFLISQSLAAGLGRHEMGEDLLNFSDHLPLFMSIILDEDELLTRPINSAIQSPDGAAKPLDVPKKRLRWDHAPLSVYCNKTYEALSPIHTRIDACLSRLLGGDKMFLFRNDVHKLKDDVVIVIEEVYSGVVAALTITADACIPLVAPHALKHWWTPELNVLKKHSKAAFGIWRGANKPGAGTLFEDYISAKKSFRKAIKKTKNDAKNIVNTALLNALNSTTDFWSLWKNKLGKKKSLPPCVGGATGEGAIANTLAAHFYDACSVNSVWRGDELRQEYLRQKNKYVCNDNLQNYLVSETQVEKAVEMLKGGKSPGADSLSGEHVKNAHPILLSILTKLFNCMILLEVVPSAFGVSTLVPIPKAGKSLSTVEGYRGISLTPVISKVFEKCILFIFSPYLKTSERQFGFKKGTGCNSAIFSVRKTVDFFVTKKSTVTLCSLDMEKAFDRMNRSALFLKMMNRRCPLTLINLLDEWFEKSVSAVRWGDCLSDTFVMRSGTRQGGVLSPILFSLFVDDVLVKLDELNCGCYINNICVNSFCYADDLILLALSLQDMNRMLAVCKRELDWLDMSLNVNKSSAIRIGERWEKRLPPLVVGDKDIPWGHELKYLGVVIVAAVKFLVALHPPKVKFFQSLNAIMGKIGDSQAVGLVLSLAATNCVPVLLYGLEACSLTNAQLSSLEHAYNAVFFKVFKSFDAQVILKCQFYTGFLPLRKALDLLKLRFLVNLLADKNSLTGFLCRTVGAEVLRMLREKYNIDVTLTHAGIKKRIWEVFTEELGLL